MIFCGSFCINLGAIAGVLNRIFRTAQPLKSPEQLENFREKERVSRDQFCLEARCLSSQNVTRQLIQGDGHSAAEFLFLTETIRTYVTTRLACAEARRDQRPGIKETETSGSFRKRLRGPQDYLYTCK